MSAPFSTTPATELTPLDMALQAKACFGSLKSQTLLSLLATLHPDLAGQCQGAVDGCEETLNELIDELADEQATDLAQDYAYNASRRYRDDGDLDDWFTASGTTLADYRPRSAWGMAR